MSAPLAPCRVTVVAPQSRMDVALPRDCTVAELVPQLVRLARGRPQPGGWALARLGETPFAPGLTVAAAALRDGEVLHLRPRERYEVPVFFDDVVDAIAAAAETRRGAWRPRVGRWLGIGSAVALFLGGTLLAFKVWSGTPAAPLGAGVPGALLLLMGAALVRARGEADAGVACGITGVVVATLAGLAALPPHTWWPSDVGQIAVGSGVAVAFAGVAAVAIAHRAAWFIGIATAAGAGALIMATIVLFDVTPLHAAAVAAPVATALTTAAPMIALRLARLPLPRLPADMETFRADEEPVADVDVLGRTSAATDILTGLVGALGVVVFACAVVLLGEGSWLVGLLGVTWILRSRSYAGAVQRVVLVVIGLAMLGALGWWLTTAADRTWLLAYAAGAGTAGVVCLWYAGRVVRNVHSPSVARWLNVLEYTLLIAIVPVAGWVLGVYRAVLEAVS